MAPPKRKLKVSHVVPVPLFDPDTMEYETWKTKLLRWNKLSSLPEAEKALTFHLSLTGRAEIASANIPDEELEKDGVKKILEKLDPIYMPDIWQRQFYNFLELHRLHKKEGVNMHDFICDFDHKYHKFQQVNGEMADTVLAFMLLSACQMSDENTQLVKAGVGKQITYANMKETLKRIFGDQHMLKARGYSPNPGVSSEASDILYSENAPRSNDIEILYTSGRIYGERGGSSSRGYLPQNPSTRGRASGRFRGRGFRGGSRGNYSYERPTINYGGRRVNPLDRYGNPTSCSYCKSILHYRANCPDIKARSSEGRKKDDNDAVKFMYMVGWGCLSGNVVSKINDLVCETRDYTVLDCGCPNTVCGERWMKNYISCLVEDDRKRIKFEPSLQTFTFGDGTEVKSKRTMTIPCWMGGVRGSITTEVVDCNIPLLFSRISMEKADMVIYCKKNQVTINGGKPIPLKVTNTGHYALPISL